MSLYPKRVLDLLLADQSLGAGNFVYKLLENRIDNEGDCIILDDTITLPSGETTKALSLKHIIDLADTLAQWHYDKGVEPKDPVALYFDDSIQYFVHYVALSRIGAVPVFINGRLDKEVVSQYIMHVGTTRLISHQERIEGLMPYFKCKCYRIETYDPAFEALPSNVRTYKAYAHQPDDPVLLAHTSGTTGMPKAVQFNHEGFIFGVKRQLFKQVGERILLALSHSHASTLSMLMSALLRGCVIKMQSRKTPENVLAAIESFKPDLFVSFPKVYVDICRFELDAYDLSSISHWLSTGDANHEPHIKKLIQYGSHGVGNVTKPGSIFVDNLGSSEFGFAAFRNVHKPGDDNYDRRIGKPFDWVTAEVLDDDGRPLLPYQVGKLGVKSQSVTAGYWNNSLLTEKNRLAGYWLTGDLVYKDRHGYFYHVDRIPDRIATPEGTLYSCQTEELILKHFPEIFDCSIVGITVEGEVGAPMPVITVELISDDVDEGELLSRINSVLRDKGVPVGIQRLKVEPAHLHVGVTGKKLKRKLREATDRQWA